MNKVKQNEAIAKALGAEWFDVPPDNAPHAKEFARYRPKRILAFIQPYFGGHAPLPIAGPDGDAFLIPDYTSDLNAAFQLVDFLRKKDGWLCDIKNYGNLWHVLFWEQDARYDAEDESLAAAICSAAISLLGLWEDEKPA